jgi:hypothetical protein
VARGLYAVRPQPCDLGSALHAARAHGESGCWDGGGGGGVHSRRLATVAAPHSEHYFHWFVEDLPRLLLLEEYFAGKTLQGDGGEALQDDDVQVLQ